MTNAPRPGSWCVVVVAVCAALTGCTSTDDEWRAVVFPGVTGARMNEALRRVVREELPDPPPAEVEWVGCRSAGRVFLAVDEIDSRDGMERTFIALCFASHAMRDDEDEPPLVVACETASWRMFGPRPASGRLRRWIEALERALEVDSRPSSVSRPAAGLFPPADDLEVFGPAAGGDDLGSRTFGMELRRRVDRLSRLERVPPR
jgi:hypothetical protein